MKKLLAIVLILFVTMSMATNTFTAQAKSKAKATCITQSEVQFENSFRKLWIDHVLWTSNYITSATTPGTENQEEILARLMKNQEEIGNAIKPYYGEEAGNQLTTLLKEHITLAGEIVAAANTGNQAKLDELNKKWYANADEMAAFLSKANPNLKLADVKSLLYMHLKSITDDLATSLAKDWNANIAAIDEGVTHIIMMSDTITNAIIKQFPEKFKN